MVKTVDVVVTLEFRFSQTPDGSIWTHSIFGYSFWKRYLQVFSQIYVVARVEAIKVAGSRWQRADGDGVTFVGLPSYRGLWQCLLAAPMIRRAVIPLLNRNRAVIMRVDPQLASVLLPCVKKRAGCYAVEVVTDPYDLFAPGSFEHPLRPLLRNLLTKAMQRICHGAVAASYVTSYALQRRYPCSGKSFAVSDVDLSNFPVGAGVLTRSERLTSSILIFVGTMAHLSKGQQVLLDAFELCLKRGMDLRLIIIGDGRYRHQLELTSIRRGFGSRIRFLGQLSSGVRIREEFNAADLFVLPSYQEGLPRSLVEAMACGLPCIGSDVGGIPELLDVEDLVSPGNAMALANAIQAVFASPDRMKRMSTRNRERATAFVEEALMKHRVEFYNYVAGQILMHS